MVAVAASAIEEGELTLDGVRVFYRRVAGRGDADGLLPRQPDPRRGLAAVHGARRARDRDRHAGLGALGPPRPGSLRLLDVRALGLPRALPGRARRRRAQARRPRLGRPGADRRPAPPGAGREAGRHQRGAADCPATAGTGSPQIWRRRPVGEIVNATDDPLGARPAAAPGARRPQPDAARVRRHDLGPLGRRAPVTAILALYRHADPDRLAAGRQGPRQAHLPVAGRSGASATPTSRPSSPRPTPTPLPDSRAGARPRRRPLALDRRRPASSTASSISSPEPSARRLSRR